jgi:hypothetical protein
MDKVLLPRERVEELLGELCVKYGFCLNPVAYIRILNSPPRTIDRFTEVVFSAEGMDCRYHRERHGLYEQVRATVARYFDLRTNAQ